MKILARVILALTIVLWLAAIWIPEHWLQLLLTGILALIVGASILGQKSKA
ncbi:hypothetical protein [Paenarthrobacter ilicis]|uniref:hypothetical protein n=1 Tax=Paenarthrobacter ilicis TaxID=43665 RepID=UPI0028D250F3|nr:hypothetical protein [Paenarthrobacter ilicis]